MNVQAVRAGVILGGVFATGVAVSGAITFSDVTSPSGLSGPTYGSPTGHSLGINWIDYNSDLWPDLFVVGGAANRPPRLYRNNGDGTFSDMNHLLPTLPAAEMTGSRFADFDADGDVDIFIYTDNEDWRTIRTDNEPDGPLDILLVSRRSDDPESVPLFVENAGHAGLDDPATPPLGELPGYRSKTAAWFDFNRDGCIDLFVGRLVINSTDESANRNRLYRNQCDGTFTDVSGSLAADPDGTKGTLASGAFHLDDDLWPDLYVVNVTAVEPEPYHGDQLYLNVTANQTPGFRLATPDSVGLGDDSQAGMGITVSDVDLDGDWDIYISDLLNTSLDAEPLGNVFYLGQGDGTFSDNLAAAAGITGTDSWGVNFADFDLDGWDDLFVGPIALSSSGLIYRNLGVEDNGVVQFEDVTASAGLSLGNARGSAVADFDRDGDLDLAVVNQNGPLQLFRNDSSQVGRWIGIHLFPTISNRDAIGAVVEVEADRRRIRQVSGGNSAHSQDDPAQIFGLGNYQGPVHVKVSWPSGRISTFSGARSGSYMRVSEDLMFRTTFERS